MPSPTPPNPPVGPAWQPPPGPRGQWQAPPPRQAPQPPRGVPEGRRPEHEPRAGHEQRSEHEAASSSHGEHEAASSEHGANEHEHTKLALLIALSIAVVSVLGAIVGWRAEVHASRASRYDQDTVATSITSAQDNSQAEAAAAKAYSNYQHYVKLGHEAIEIIANACSISNRSTLPELDAGALCSTQVQFSGYASAGYLDSSGRFDLQKYAADVQTGNALLDDLDAEKYKAQSEVERHHEDRMLYLSLFLVLSLALLTLARLGKTTGTRLVLAVPGWLTLIAGTVFLVMAEV